MEATVRTRSWKHALGVGAGLSALVFTFGCGGTRELNTPLGSAVAAAPATNTPVVVSCAPTQRTMVRPAVVNGVAVSQVECIPADPMAVAYGSVETAPLATPVAYRQPVAAQPISRGLNDTQIVPLSAPARVAPARQVVYQDARPAVRKTQRSVAKSAVIIGSSAGAGAGVGAIVGGKKGALIGAAIGGGGAAIWDQITRRK
jgi:hypothetical protein